MTWKPNTYPTARRSDHVDVYESKSRGQVRVPDPYQWLEKDTEETQKWVSAQEAYTKSYIAQHSEERKLLEDAIRANTNYAKFSAPGLGHDGRWYWYYNSGLQAQSVLYRSKGKELPDFSKNIAETSIGEIFFDSNLLAEDGTAALSDFSMSKDGRYWAYGVSLSGSDFSTIYVRSTDAPLAAKDGQRPTHHDNRLSDEIRFVKFSRIAWTHDSKGFFYHRFPDRESHGTATEDKAGTETTGDRNSMLCYHRIGTPQSEDIVVMKDDKNPEWMWSADVSEIDGKYLYLYTSKDTSRTNLLWVADLEKEEVSSNMKWDKLFNEFDADYGILANDGTKFYIRTNKDADQYKISTIDLADSKRALKDLIPEDKSAHLDSAKFIDGDKLVVVFKRDVKDEIYIYNADGRQIKRLDPDFVGAATVGGKRAHSYAFSTLVGFTTPGTVKHYDFKTDTYNTFRVTQVTGINPDELEAKQVWYESKDGTKVPMFIVRHKSTPFDGTAPAIQYGYGGFSISVNPFFSPAILTFMKTYGAILAVPNIRGGAEFGETWHLAGTRERKINVFNDFIAATEYLVKEKYAGKGKVAINGGSNGGLLVGACVNIAPEGTFGAAVAEVGVLDLLKFPEFTIGRAWTADYGDPKKPEDFDFIYPISPLHNVPTNKVLPPTILLTADHDDRVVPLHSFKHAATLQHTLPNNPNPLLIRIDTKSGHGAGKSTDKRIVEAADKWSFVAQSLGLKRI